MKLNVHFIENPASPTEIEADSLLVGEFGVGFVRDEGLIGWVNQNETLMVMPVDEGNDS